MIQVTHIQIHNGTNKILKKTREFKTMNDYVKFSKRAERFISSYFKKEISFIYKEI